jgi:predicted ATPase/DNA-binding SARP family transcriptional activator
MACLEIFVLGTLEVLRDGQPVTGFGYAKVQALLAYLAVEARQVHQRETLAEMFWPDQPPHVGRASLRQALAHLRRALDEPATQTPLMATTRTTVQMIPSEHYWLDVTAFSDLLLACQQRAGGASDDEMVMAQRVQQASVLYRGDFLAGFPLMDCPVFDQWVLTHQIALRNQVMQALNYLAAFHERRGAYAQAIRVARRQIAIEAWNETAHRTLMRLLALAGERDAALAQFAHCQNILRHHLDMAPTPETYELYGQIQTGAVVPRTTHQPQASPSLSARIAAQPDPLIGREHELHILHHLLLDPTHRLVTITGPGGIGKTRLALQAAHDLADHFAHGVYLVQLDEPPDNDMLAATIADALPLHLEGQRPAQAQLLDFLAKRQLLLLLDNAEYVLDGMDVLVTILEAAPHVTLLTASRERLRVRWEWRLELAGLALPERPTGAMPGAAVQLFEYCARRVVPDFRLDATTYPAVVQICRLLEGIPLGIELAASSLATSDCTIIARQLAENLTTLRTDLRDVPQRHVSLWNVCQHSWEFLNEQEQNALRRLAVFRGGFTLAASHAVAETTAEVLASLMNKSLLRREQSGRYRMHEFIRQFAEEHLAGSGEDAAIRDRHLDYYVRLAEASEAPLCNGPQDQQLAWLHALAVETANWRAALNWAESSADTLSRGMHLVADLGWYWLYHGDFTVGWQIGEHWLTYAESVGSSIERGSISMTLGGIAYARGDYQKARDMFESARHLFHDAGPSSRKGYLHSSLGLFYLLLNDLTMARIRADEAWAIFEAIGDRGGLSHAQYVLGGVYQAEGAYQDACTCFEECLAYNLQQQNIFAILVLVASLGTLKQQMGYTEEAELLFNERMDNIRAYCTSRTGVFLPDAFEAMAYFLQAHGWTDAATRLREMARMHQP